MSYILEALRKVEQQREQLPTRGILSRRRYYSAAGERLWSRRWMYLAAALTGAVVSGGVVSYFASDEQQHESQQQQQSSLPASHPPQPAAASAAVRTLPQQANAPAYQKVASPQPVSAATLRLPGPRYDPQRQSAMKPPKKTAVTPQAAPAATSHATDVVAQGRPVQEAASEEQPVTVPEEEAPPETKQPTSPENEQETEVASVHPPAKILMEKPPLPAAAERAMRNTAPDAAGSLDMIPPPKAVEVQPFRPNDVLRPPARRSAPANASPGETPLLSTLSSQFQSMVPKMAINAQVYSPVPQQRFVVINMKRYNEGQSTAEGVSVVAIRQQDIIFSYQGQRFRLGR